MSLVEVVVYCGLLTLFSIMLFTNLPHRDSVSREDLRTAANVASRILDQWSVELSNASGNSIVVTTSPSGMIFLSAQDNRSSNFSYTSSGDLAWQGWVGYFQQGSSLVRVWYPLSGGTTRSAVASAPSPTVMLASGTSRTLSKNLKSFSVTAPQANLWQAKIQIDVKGNSVDLTSAVGVRN